VLAKIERLNRDDIILLGHSFGGRIAAHLAAQKPRWLKALILYGAPCIYRPSVKTKILNRMAKVAKKLGFSKKLSKNKELLDADKEGLGKIFRKAISFDQTKTLPQIEVETLLLWGNDDTEAPLRLAHEIHTLIPHNQLEIIDNAGHNLHTNNPNIFYGKLKKFISSFQ
jgi:pimeloyl-ACP methyl ester carboxylesterase